MKGLTQLKNRNSSGNSLRAERSAILRGMLKAKTAAGLINIPDLEKRAKGLIALGCIKATATGFEAETPSIGNFKRTFQIIPEGAGFRCECIKFSDCGICEHTVAAAQIPVADEKPFKALLEYGNRKGLDFAKEATFETQEEAVRWLVSEGFNKFLPSGYVTDLFGEVVYEMDDEFYELWAA